MLQALPLLAPTFCPTRPATLDPHPGIPDATSAAYMASKGSGTPATGRGQQCTALVTGATGITGRHCVDALLRSKEGWRVVTLSRRDLQGLSADAASRVTQVGLLEEG